MATAARYASINKGGASNWGAINASSVVDSMDFSIAVMAGVGAGVGGGATFGSSVQKIYHMLRGNMACPPDYPGWLAIFFYYIPSSKGLALPSDFN
jgi:hypothetical protein